jgi:ABC-type transport system involved in Fe-S cluster assembly fused permease/ATPase subunit
LNLISRIYDPIEGTILIDNRDIKTLRLADLRAAMSILFQDFTYFPLSVSLDLAHPRSSVPNTRRYARTSDLATQRWRMITTRSAKPPVSVAQKSLLTSWLMDSTPTSNPL